MGMGKRMAVAVVRAMRMPGRAPVGMGVGVRVMLAMAGAATRGAVPVAGGRIHADVIVYR